MSTMTIAEAIAQAQQAAAQHVQHQQTRQLPAPETSATTPVASGAPLALDDMLAGGVTVDHWLKVTPYGLTVDDRTRPLDAITVYLDMAEIAYLYAIKYQLNGQAVYHKSYDRVTDARGGSWMASLHRAQGIDPKAYEYRSAEIPLVASDDIPGKDGIAAEAGARLGLALATTAWGGFERFVRDVRRKGIDPTCAILKLTIATQTRQRTGVNDWGIPTFTAYEEVETIPMLGTMH